MYASTLLMRSYTTFSPCSLYRICTDGYILLGIQVSLAIIMHLFVKLGYGWVGNLTFLFVLLSKS